MKIVVRCVNCNQAIRRSNCYHIKLLGKISNNTIFEKPNWIDYEEKVFICKKCARKAGYRVRKEFIEFPEVQYVARENKKIEELN